MGGFMYTVYGIPNCSSVRNARKKLEEKGIDYQFRDIRKEPLTKGEWEQLLSWDQEGALINTKSQSFRGLGIDKDSLTSKTKKIEVLLQAPTSMKRPLLVDDSKILAFGFDKEFYAEL